MIDQKLKEYLKNETKDFFNKNLLFPLLEDYVKHFYEEKCFNIFSANLAEVLSEYAPDWFETNYKKRIGEYFYSSFYGDPLDEDTLIKILKSDKSETFDALNIYFEDFESIKFNLEDESIKNSRIYFDYIPEFFNRMVVKFLNHSL